MTLQLKTSQPTNSFSTTCSQSSPHYFIYIGTKLNSAKTSWKTMTGTTVYLLISHSTIEDHPINSFMFLKSANITIKKPEKAVTSNAYFHTPLSKDFTIPISIKPTSASSFWKRKNNATKISCVLLFIWRRRKEILYFAKIFLHMRPINKNFLCVWETP